MKTHAYSVNRIKTNLETENNDDWHCSTTCSSIQVSGDVSYYKQECVSVEGPPPALIEIQSITI